MRTDWSLIGTGTLSIVTDAGSKRASLNGLLTCLWNGNPLLTDSYIIGDLKFGSNASPSLNGGFILHANSTAASCYRLYITALRNYVVQKVINGNAQNLVTFQSSQAYNDYIKTRFKIIGHQITVEEYVAGQWNLVCAAIDNDTQLASGYAGFFDSGYAGYNILFDNIEIGVGV